MASYSYAKMNNGFVWNAVRRIKDEVCDAIQAVSNLDEQTVIEFSRELTLTEKLALDLLMSGGPNKPPAAGTTLLITDLWGDENGNNFEAFKAACGLPGLRLFYTESVAGSGTFDRIALWHPMALTNGQKNTIKSQYAKLFLG